jgi:hypothetical protein
MERKGCSLMVATKVSAVLSALAAAVVLAAPAYADDLDYTIALDDQGVYYSSISDVIDMGKQLCGVGRRAPLTGNAMAQGFGSVLRDGGYTSEAEAKIILGAAADHMCPDIIPRINAVMASQGVPGTNSTGE